MATTLVVYPQNDTLPEMNVNFTLDVGPDLSATGLRNALLSWNPDLWEVTKVTLLLLTMVLSLVGNSFVITVSKRLFQQSVVLRNCLISMAVVHLLLGLVIPLHLGVVVIPNFLQLAEVCIAVQASVTFYITLTMGHLVLLAIDRVVSHHHPLQFHHYFKEWHANLLLFLVWVYAAGSAGGLLLWQLEWKTRVCYPELYLGNIYRLLHLAEYAVGAFLLLIMLFSVYFLSHKKCRMDKVLKYARRRRRAADFSLRRNKLFTETLLTLGSLFLAMCGPYFGIKLIHFFTARTPITSAIQNIAILIVLMHSFVNSFVLPWKIRSYRYKCLYCVCPCVERHADSMDESESEPQVTHIQNYEVGESNTDSLYKTTGCDSIDKSHILANGFLPNITITDYDSQKRITLHSDGKVENAKRRTSPLDDDSVWSTINSRKHPLTDDEFAGSTANLYFLNPVDNDFLDIPTEDEV